MKFTKNEQGYIIRLERGEEIISEIQRFCEEHSIQGSTVAGLGAIESGELGFYHLDRKEYSWKKFGTAMEAVSLTGNIALVDKKPFAHIHAVLSDQEFNSYGGHLKEAIVGATIEIILTPINSIKRSYNEETGLKLLDCESSQ